MIEEIPGMARKTRKREAKDDKETSNKRMKYEKEGQVWGEQVTPENKAVAEFLRGPCNEVLVRNLVQMKITPLTKASMMARFILNTMISEAVQLSSDLSELQMAEEALRNEVDWTLVEDEVNHAQDDIEDLINILKEVDIESRNKIPDKPAPKKRLSHKQQRLQDAAKSSKKITDFFSKMRKPPVVKKKEESVMEWEDNTVEWDDLPTLSWSTIERMEKNREKVRRCRRA